MKKKEIERMEGMKLNIEGMKSCKYTLLVFIVVAVPANSPDLYAR